MLSAACTGPVKATHVVDARGRHDDLAAAPVLANKLDALLDGRLRLIGATVKTTAKPGEKVPLTLAFLVERECAGSPMVFVHVAAPGAEVNQAQADHALPLTASEWRPGDLLVDTVDIDIPASIGVDELLVWAGLYEGKQRWSVSPSAAHDGNNRVEVGRIHVDGAPPFRVEAEVHERKQPIQIDGVLDEPDWARAAVLGPFIAWDAKTAITRATTAKLLWDADNLYLAFRGEDPDVFTPYRKRDDPLYESEAVEIFIDADGDKDVYVELQAAPQNDVHFDAAFAGGRRKNMDTRYDVDYQTKTVVDATGFTSEWRIPVKPLKDVPMGEPHAGASWKINLFRLERVRDASKTRVIKNEASAWSTPLSGDFHNLDRFGTITFVP
ncbi:MAG TPA: carbohydrate-binding family 9-like protein [Myxococcota bacterium]